MSTERNARKIISDCSLQFDNQARGSFAAVGLYLQMFKTAENEYREFALTPH
jgi:hypothetical protein